MHMSVIGRVPAAVVTAVYSASETSTIVAGNNICPTLEGALHEVVNVADEITTVNKSQVGIFIEVHRPRLSNVGLPSSSQSRLELSQVRFPTRYRLKLDHFAFSQPKPR